MTKVNQPELIDGLLESAALIRDGIKFEAPKLLEDSAEALQSLQGKIVSAHVVLKLVRPAHVGPDKLCWCPVDRPVVLEGHTAACHEARTLLGDTQP